MTEHLNEDDNFKSGNLTETKHQKLNKYDLSELDVYTTCPLSGATTKTLSNNNTAVFAFPHTDT